MKLMHKLKVIEEKKAKKMILTYLDTGVLIAAFRGENIIAEKALVILLAVIF
jgi:hypothetical protein